MSPLCIEMRSIRNLIHARKCKNQQNKKISKKERNTNNNYNNMAFDGTSP